MERIPCGATSKAVPVARPPLNSAERAMTEVAALASEGEFRKGVLRGEGSLEWWKVVICLVEGLGRGRRASEDQFGEERSGRVDGLVRLREALIWYFLNGVDCRRTLLTRRRMKEFEKSVIDMQMPKYLLAAEIHCRCCSSYICPNSWRRGMFQKQG